MPSLSARLALLAVVSALALPVRATPASAPLDLPAAIRLALDQPAVRAASHEVAASDALVGQAGRLPNPELSWLREGRDAGARTTTLQLNQPVELGGKRSARVALAQGAADAARSALLARRQAMRAAVIAGWYALLVAQRKLALAHDASALAGRTVDVAGKRVAAGKASPIDVTRARLAGVDADAALAQAQADVAAAAAELGALVGRPAAALDPAAQDDAIPEAPPLAAWLARAAQAPAVQSARSQRAQRSAQVAVERAARIPDLTLSAGTQRIDGIDRRQAVFGIAIPLPLFDRNEGNLRAALRRSDEATDALAAAEMEAAAQVTALHARYTAARVEATLLRRDVVPQAQQAYEQTLKGFEYGKFAFLDVLDAQRTWFQAQSRQWDSLLAACRAYADLERLAGPADTR